MSARRPRNETTLLVLFGLNAITRVYFSLQTSFGADEVSLYQRVSRFLLTGQIFTADARLVPNEIPGVLPEILMGLPLWLTGGWLRGPAIFIALLSAFAALILARVYQSFFEKWDVRAVFIAIAFAPWTYVYTGFNGSAFLFPLSVAVVWSIAAWARGTATPIHAITLGAAILFAAQFNLAAVFLALWALIALTLSARNERNVRALHFPFIALGFLLGGLTVLPAYLGHSFATPAVPFALVLSSVRFEWNHFEALYKVFFRFLSFPTGELTRFLGGAQGFGGAFARMAKSPVLLGSGCITLAAVVWVSLCGIRFSSRRAVYQSKPLDETLASAHFRRWAALAPFLMMALFLFSRKGPMPHTLLPLLPLSFFPFFWEFRNRPLPVGAVSIVAAAQIVFALGGYMRVTRPTLLTTSRAVECSLRDPSGARCPRIQREALLEADPRAVQLIAETVRSYQSTRR